MAGGLTPTGHFNFCTGGIMLYRINYKNFLTYAIDYFTRDELAGINYIIISAKVRNNGKATNVLKNNELYPTIEAGEVYDSTKDLDILEKIYRDSLFSDENIEAGYVNNESWGYTALYKILHPVLQNKPVMLICDSESNEDAYVDVICRILKKEFSLDAINLNQLFTTGHVGPYRIDLDKIHDKSVKIARSITQQAIRDKASTKEGRRELISQMSKKEKLKNLKKFGVKLTDRDMENIDQILLDEWCDHDGMED